MSLAKLNIFSVKSVGIIVALVVILGGLFLISHKNPPASILFPTAAELENGIYLGNYQSEKVLFYTNKNLQKYYENNDFSVESYNPNIGSIELNDGTSINNVDYRKLTSMQRILNLPYPVGAVISYRYDPTKTQLYVSILLDKSGNYLQDWVRQVYRIDTKTLQAELLWSNLLGSKKYQARGATYVDRVLNTSYIALTMDDCYACSGYSRAAIILNILSKQEKYLDMAGNVQINAEDNTFSYQKFAPFSEQCPARGGPGCDKTNHRIVYRPAGTIITEQLP